MFGSKKKFDEELQNLKDDAMAAHQSWKGLRAQARQSGNVSKDDMRKINDARQRQIDADEKVQRAARSGRI